jgi:cell division transport system permease protein
VLLPRLRFFVTQAAFGLWRSAGVTAISVLTIGVALAILAVFFVALQNLSRVADQLGREVEISAYLERSLPAEDAEKRGAELRAWSEVSAVEVLSSSVAMTRFRESLGRDAIILEGLPSEVLPPSLEIRLTARAWSVDEVRALAERLLRLPGIEDVRYGQEDIERLNALLSFTRASALVVAVVLCLAVVLLVSNTIRLAVYARRDEIEIMSLIGATDAFVRTPFVIEGAIQGFLGGLFACLVLVSLRHALIQGLAVGLSYAYGPLEIELVPAAFFAYALALGTGLGFLGSLFAAGRFVRV